eukprot:13064951-Alexandrium_andersonii.AAC.1
MSASLVGSEMCIRDSIQSAGAPGPSGPHKPRAEPCPKALKKTAHCTGAVSYTHLTLPTICSV